MDTHLALYNLRDASTVFKVDGSAHFESARALTFGNLTPQKGLTCYAHSPSRLRHLCQESRRSEIDSFLMLFPLVALQHPWNASKFGITAKKCTVFVGFCWFCSCFPLNAPSIPTFFGGPIAYLPISATFQGTCSPLGIAPSIHDFFDSGWIWRGSLGNVASIPVLLWWIYCISSHEKSMLQFGKSDIIPTLNH